MSSVNHAQTAAPDPRAMQGCCTISFVLYEPSLSHVLHNCMYSRLPWIAVNFDVPINFFLSCDTANYAIVRSSFCVCTLWQPSRVFVNFYALCFSACCSQMEHSRSCYLMSTIRACAFDGAQLRWLVEEVVHPLIIESCKGVFGRLA